MERKDIKMIARNKFLNSVKRLNNIFIYFCKYGHPNLHLKLTWHRSNFTIRKWITSISLQTITNWCMVYNIAFCADTTCAWTRISAFWINARFIARTIWVDRALRLTIWRCSYIHIKTCTCGWSVYISTLWIRATRWRIARISSNILNWWFVCYKKIYSKYSHLPLLKKLRQLTGI